MPVIPGNLRVGDELRLDFIVDEVEADQIKMRAAGDRKDRAESAYFVLHGFGSAWMEFQSLQGEQTKHAIAVGDKVSVDYMGHGEVMGECFDSNGNLIYVVEFSAGGRQHEVLAVSNDGGKIKRIAD